MSTQPKQRRLYTPESTTQLASQPIKRDNFIVCKTLHSQCFSRFNEMRNNKQLCDVKLVSKNHTQKLWAHKIVLAANSDYFNIMFNGQFKESNVSEIIFEQLGGSILTLLIDFIYTSKLVITEKNMHEIINGFCLLQFKEHIQNQCFDNIKSRISPSNCLGLKETVECLGLKEFGEFCFKYVLIFYKDVIENSEFTLISHDQLQQIIESEELCADEEVVFVSVLKWIKFDIENRSKHLARLMKFVRLPILSNNFLIETVEKEPLLEFDNDCIHYLSEAQNDEKESELKTPTTIENSRARYRKKYSEYILIISKNDSKSSPLLFNAITKTWKYLHVNLPSISKGSSYLLSDGRVIDFAGPEPLATMRNNPNLRDYMDGWNEAIIHEFTSEGVNKTSTTPMCEVHAETNIVQIGNRIYVICYFNSEYYDIDRNKWFKMKYSPIVRTCFSVIAMDGFIYTIGGNVGKCDTNMVEKYNPETCEWVPVAPMKYGRRCISLCVFDGCIYAIGGTGGSSHRHIFLSTVEKYDPIKNIWEDVASLNYIRANAGAAAINGKIYVFGGTCENSSIEEYCPFQNQWSVLPLVMPKRFGRNTICTSYTIHRRDQHKFLKFSYDTMPTDF